MMDCADSMAPNDEVLLRVLLDGEDEGILGEGVRMHLQNCPICQQRRARYQRVQKQLVSRLFRSKCPDTMKISDFCAHLLPVDEVMAITLHIQICPLCAQEVAETRRFYANLALADPFPALEPRLTLRRILATLIPWQPQLVTRGDRGNQGAHDSQRELAAAYASWPRQYRAETLTLSLHLSRSSQGEIMLLGLFTSIDPHENVDDFVGVRIALYSSTGILPLSEEPPLSKKDYGQPLLTAEVDDLGHLVFEAVPIGNYTMIVHMPDREIVVEGLTIVRG